MPVLGGARQPAHLQAEHDADVVQRHLRKEPLIPRTIVGPRAALALILIDSTYPDRFAQLVSQAMPIIGSFVFK